MKLNRIYLILIFLLLATFLIACSSGSNSDSENPGTNSNGGNDDTQNGDGSQDGDEPQDSDFTIIYAASRTTGVAPLGVFFNANFSSSTSDDKPFHDREYSWDFGDSVDARWGIGEDSVSDNLKNTAKGPVAAHVYESPGTYTVTLTTKTETGVTVSEQSTITVEDPDVVFAGINTTCISSDSSTGAFDGCPDGSEEVVMTDISEMNDYVSSGKRVLLRRGSSWTITSGRLYSPGIEGPVIIGAYGDCSGADNRGICANAPIINVDADNSSVGSLSGSTDWRIMDIVLNGTSVSYTPFGGAADINSLLILRVNATGFESVVNFSRYTINTDYGHDQIMLVENDFSNFEGVGVYLGSERLVMMGNQVKNSMTTHVVRVWQAYMGVISHNTISGSSIGSTSGRHALKLHAGAQVWQDQPGKILAHPDSTFVVVANNIFGSSGPYPVIIGPQNGDFDERLGDIIIEKNKFLPSYGTQSERQVTRALYLEGRYLTVRNNMFDGNGTGVSQSGYYGVTISRAGSEPLPLGNRVYNNTFYKTEMASDSDWKGFAAVQVSEEATDTVVKNNLVTMPDGDLKAVVRDFSSDLIESDNLLTDTPGLLDPNTSNPLLKDFNLIPSSDAIDIGATVPVSDDFNGKERPAGDLYDIGAFEYLP